MDLEKFSSLWRLDDREWLRERKKRWMSIQPQLISMERRTHVVSQREDIEFHKTFFLTGKVPVIDAAAVDKYSRFYKRHDGNPYPFSLPFIIWYIPEINEEVLSSIREAKSGRDMEHYLNLLSYDPLDDAKFKPECFADRVELLDKCVGPQNFDEYYAARTHGRIIKNPDEERERIWRSFVGGSFLADLCTKLQKAIVASVCDDYYCNNYLGVFSFPLLRETIVGCSQKGLLEGHGRYLPIRSLERIMTYALSYEPASETLHFGIPRKAHLMLMDFFDGGVREEVDELWAKLKASGIEKRNL